MISDVLVFLVSGSVGWARVSVLRHPVEPITGADHGHGREEGRDQVLDVSWMMPSGSGGTFPLYWEGVGSHWTETRRTNVSIGARRTLGVSGTLTMKGKSVQTFAPQNSSVLIIFTERNSAT